MNTKTKNASIWLKLRAYIEDFTLKFRTNNGASSEDANANNEEEKSSEQKKHKQDNKSEKAPKKTNNNQNNKSKNLSKQALNKAKQSNDNKDESLPVPEPEELEQKTALKAYQPKVEDFFIEKEATIFRDKSNNSVYNATIKNQSKVLLNESFVASIYILSFLYPLFGFVLNIVGYISGYHNEQNYVGKYVRMNLNLMLSLFMYYVVLFKILEFNPHLEILTLPISNTSWFSWLGGDYSIFFLAFYAILTFNFIRAALEKKAMYLIAIPILRK